MMDLYKKSNKMRTKGLSLLIPYLSFYFLFLLLPIIWTFLLSLQKGGLLTGLKYTGLTNYFEVWKDQVFVKTIKNTVYYVVLIIPSVMFFSLCLAVVINKMRRFHNLVKACIFSPLVCPIVPLCIAWIPLLVPGTKGAFNYFLKIFFNIPPQNWLGSAKLAIPTIAIFEFWRGFGFWTIIFLGGLASIPEELYEAAKVDGATEIRQFFHITIPLLRPTFVFLTVMGFVWNFQIFDAVYMLTRGGPGFESYTMVWYVYKNAFLYENVGYAATMGIVLLIIIGLLAFVVRKLLEKG